MRILEDRQASDDASSPEALIREARRRQRRRWLAGLSLVAVLAAGLGALASFATSGPRRPPATSHHAAHRSRPPSWTSTGLSGLDATVILWPVGYPAFGPEGGPPAYVADLGKGRLFERSNGIGAGDYQPLAVPVGRFLVYVGTGTTAISDQIAGAPRVLGSTPTFAAAAQAGHVWLVYSGTGSRPPTARLVAVAGGRPGPPIKLPAGSSLLAGTGNGLLLVNSDGRVELWRPGASPWRLPGRPYFEDGFASSDELVAYGSECRDEVTASNAPLGNAGYEACGELRILNVLTRRLESIPAPPGTAGWVPDEFDVVNAISPNDTMIAAYAVSSSYGRGAVHVFVVSLATPHRLPRAVPGSAALLFARTAWSPSSAWLFFQGPQARMVAFRPATGQSRSSSIPCCRYTVMFALPGSP